MTPAIVDEIVAGKRQAFVFLCDRALQVWNDPEGDAVIVAATIEAAEIVKATLEKKPDTKILIVEVGPLVTYAPPQALALMMNEHGLERVAVTDDGETICFAKPELPDANCLRSTASKYLETLKRLKVFG